MEGGRPPGAITFWESMMKWKFWQNNDDKENKSKTPKHDFRCFQYYMIYGEWPRPERDALGNAMMGTKQQ